MSDWASRANSLFVAVAGVLPSDDWTRRLLERYRAPGRHYHGLDHIDACLDWSDWLAGAARDFPAVRLALLTHDVVYDPRRRDNERRSASFVARELERAGVDGARIARIVAMIHATEGHAPETDDARLVVDIDLTILGARPARYDAFERAVRREFAHVPETDYIAGRRRVLQHFLSRRRLYTHPALVAEREDRARANLSRTLAGLRAAA